MKKIISLALALVMILTLGVSFIACDNTEDPADTTVAVGDNTTGAPDDATNAPDDATNAPDDATNAPDDATNAPADETTAAPDDDVKEIHIATAEDLLKLNTDAASGADYAYYTIIFDADIDLGGAEWTPMTGSAFMETTFEGNNHTIKNFKITAEKGTNYIGFIGQTYGGYIAFNNLNFSDVTITAAGKEIGIFIGWADSTIIDFNNCSVKNTRVDGYYDYITDKDAISFRIAAFVGCNRKGVLTFTKCTVDGFEASGFHNLASLVGYDENSMTEAENCVIKNVTLKFSYTMSESYSLWQEKKYVNVFYCYNDYSDTLEGAASAGNTYENVVFIDLVSGTELDPATFITGNTEAPQS